MILTSVQHAQLVAHARDVAPFECCGFMRLDRDQVLEVVRGENVRATSATYELDLQSLINAAACADRGDGIALYHSHPQTPAEPSLSDVRLATYPDWRYVIVSLAGTPTVRAWWIRGRDVDEDELTIQD